MRRRRLPCDPLSELTTHPPARPAVSTAFLSEELTTSSRPELASASRVVSGGRALKSQESFNQIMEPLADSLEAGEWAEGERAGRGGNELMM